MTWLWFGVTIFAELIFASIEFIILGETFPHIYSSVFLLFMSTSYFHYTNKLGEFLLSLHLNATAEESNDE